MNKFYFAFAACLVANAAWAADAISGEVQQRPLNVPAVVMFFIFVGATLFITKWAAKKNKSSKDFYTAGGGISVSKRFGDCGRLYVGGVFPRDFRHGLHARV